MAQNKVGRREKKGEKVGKREKLAQRVGRREIYPLFPSRSASRLSKKWKIYF